MHYNGHYEETCYRLQEDIISGDKGDNNDNDGCNHDQNDKL